MNITIISLRGPTNNDLKGGAREYIKDLAVPWVKEGHNVNLICGEEPKYSLPSEEVVEGIKIHRVKKEGFLTYSIWKYYQKKFSKLTDVLIENMVSFPLLSPLYSRNKKKLTIIHHLTGKEYFKSHSLPKAILGYSLEEYVIPFIYNKTKILTVSELTTQELVRIGIKDKNISILSPGIDNMFFTPSEKSESPLIVYVGRYDGKMGVKKVDHLIEAFNVLKGEIPNLNLVIAGPTKYKSELESLCKEKDIHLLGFITDNEKRELLQKAWVFASPSTREGFGITYIEANACGTPVVGYEIEGLKTVPKDAGIMVKSNDINSLTNALREIIINDDLRNKMYENALNNSEKYTKTNFIKESVNIISEF